ncbi:HU family DNA-binding protein [Aeromonas caviae]|uniref:HU family DNA-binding protein n=1 Tax=Aeromonas caviae TaxID=648 RepID=UPI0029DE3F22|nr:HU family DNA-binding protein [Aeromonas caviae]MDX7711812.1 HU family DNA-binding protein [Aeromonas caviae]
MNKQDLIREIAEDTGMTASACEKFLNALTARVQTAVKNGEEVAIHGFGKFAPAARAARVGRNPQNGEPVNIPARVDLTFKAGKQVKDFLNA